MNVTLKIQSLALTAFWGMVTFGMISLLIAAAKESSEFSKESQDYAAKILIRRGVQLKPGLLVHHPFKFWIVWTQRALIGAIKKS